jgi:hypothetical protein
MKTFGRGKRVSDAADPLWHVELVARSPLHYVESCAFNGA